jgi:DNA repair photolyase
VSGDRKAYKGRGSVSNPDCRYDAYRREAADDGWPEDDDAPPAPATTVSVDATRTIIARNSSPDVPFEQSINPYRGCEHGCIYCFARPTHAYLGLSPGLDFETRLFCKPDAPRLLQGELDRAGYQCRVLALGANTDCYQPVERKWQITRGILETLAAHRHPVTIVTKSALVERDMDLLAPMAESGLVQVNVSVTTLDPALARRLEPRAAAPHRRLQTIERLARAGIPTGVLVAPIIPVLTDGELETILQSAADGGAGFAGYVLLRLPLEVKDLFKEWLQANAPLKADHVMGQVREARQGRENDARFGARMRGNGAYADLIGRRFDVARRRLGLASSGPALRTDLFCRPARSGDQLTLL